MLAQKRLGPRPAAMEATIRAAILLVLAGAAWLLYGSTLRLWWIDDDFVHLRLVITHRPFWYFFDAAVYGEFRGNLTPLLFFSLDMDRRLSGLASRAFHFHQLAALSLCAAAVYGALRSWLPRLWAAVGAWIFLIGPVTASLALLVAARHYVEVILLATLSLMAWAGALRRYPGSAAWKRAGLSAALYLAACLAKEVAVPLCVVLPLLPPPGSRPVSFHERLRLAVPHAAALVLYLAFRYAMMGTLLGGYGFVVPLSDLPALALALPGKVATEFVGGFRTPAAVVFALALAAGVAALLLPPRGLRAAALLGVALLLALLPVLPVSTLMQPRFAMPAWLVLAAAFAAGCSTLAGAESRTRRSTAFAIAAVACASGLWLNRQDWSARFATAERKSAENRFFLEMSADDVLRQPLTLAATLQELEWMKKVVLRLPLSGRWFQDDLYLCLHRGGLGRVWGYAPDARRVVDITPQLPALRARYCSSIRSGAPLRAGFRVANQSLFWDLGPYPEGRYWFVMDDGGQVFEMPRRAGFGLRNRSALPPLRIRYESPAGWITYSPELRLLRTEGWSLRWSRP